MAHFCRSMFLVLASLLFTASLALPVEAQMGGFGRMWISYFQDNFVRPQAGMS